MKRLFSTTTLLALSAVVIAQEPTQPTQQNPQPRNRMESAQNGMNANDALLATWLLVDNENEIALARIAVQRSQSAEVKQFAQQMIDDHTKMVQKLRLTSGTAGADGPRSGDANRPEGENPRGTDTDRPDTGRPSDASQRTGDNKNQGGTRPSGNPTDAAGGRMVSGDMMALVRELGRKCQESSAQMLQEKQGSEFDRCYMGMAVAAHMKAVDTIETFRKHASTSLKPVLEEALPVVQMHLQHAKAIAKKSEVAMTESARR